VQLVKLVLVKLLALVEQLGLLVVIKLELFEQFEEFILACLKIMV
tara:strand:- start:598 stop:732 length:135 start_codon:yes stop_codon:yes gene_type:complete